MMEEEEIYQQQNQSDIKFVNKSPRVYRLPEVVSSVTPKKKILKQVNSKESIGNNYFPGGESYQIYNMPTN